METNGIEFSQSLGGLAKALAAAQAKITGAVRDRKNPHTGSMYADLANIWSVIREPFSSNGLAVVQTTEPHGMEGVCVLTTLMHESGEWIRGRLFVPCVGQRRKDGTVMPVDAQTFGSALTYARRYALAAIAGVAPEDDDGEAAVQNSREQVGKPAASKTTTAGKPQAALSEPATRVLNLLMMAKSADDLSKAAVEAAALKGKEPASVIDQFRAEHDRAMRRIETDQAHAAGAL